MALTRAQLLSGNSANGIVLPGQPQGVIAGAGITIDAGGIISVNAATAVGLMRLNNPAAYNAYVWPTGGGSLGQQLTSDGAGNLSWAPASGVAWTIKGQLVVGTGIGTDTLLNAGPDTSFLMASSGTASGLAYSHAVSTAAQLPSGLTTQRPAAPTPGVIRYNSTTGEFEGYGGLVPAWSSIGGVDEGLGIDITGNVVKLEVPVQFGPPAAGTLPAEAIDGSLYWDDNSGLLFIRYNDGTSTQWVQVIPTGGNSGTVTSVGITGTSGIGVVSGSPVTTAGSITLAIDIVTLPVLP
jgi:hypothetical protein